MRQAIKNFLARLLQAIQVWVLRFYYRLANAWAWRGQTSSVRHDDRQIPVPGALLNARFYRSEMGADRPLIVYFHGGGWVIGGLETHHHFCQTLCETTGCSVIVLAYRLAPERPFPTAHNDCLLATHWIAQQLEKLGLGNGKLVLAGDSAGANLATCVCLEANRETRARIIAEVLIYPAVDYYTAGFDSYVEKAKGQALTTSLMQWFWNAYLGKLPEQALETQRAFPLRSAQLASLPPTLLITAENDPLRDEGKAYAEKLRVEGVAVSYQHFPAAEHGFACSHGPSADARDFMKQLASWLAALK